MASTKKVINVPMPGYVEPKTKKRVFSEVETKVVKRYANPKKQRFVDISYNIDDKIILFNWLYDVIYISCENITNNKRMVYYTTTQLFNRVEKLWDIYQYEIQLVGAACLWIATKYHSLVVCKGKELTYLSGGAFTYKNLKAVELDILVDLGKRNNLKVNSPYEYLSMLCVDLTEDKTQEIFEYFNSTLHLNKTVDECYNEKV